MTNTLEHTRVVLSLLRQELVPTMHKVLRVSAAAVPWLAWIFVLQLLCAAFLLFALTLP